MFASLAQAGDNRPRRRVEHVVTGIARDRVDDFVRAVEAIGVTVTPQPDGNIQIVHEAEPVAVTDDAWTIRLIAERFGGAYDGWTCAVLRDERTRNRQRGRWIRRSRSD